MTMLRTSTIEKVMIEKSRIVLLSWKQCCLADERVLGRGISGRRKGVTGTMADWPVKNTDVAATIRSPSAPEPGIISAERLFNSSDPLENEDDDHSAVSLTALGAAEFERMLSYVQFRVLSLKVINNCVGTRFEKQKGNKMAHSVSHRALATAIEGLPDRVPSPVCRCCRPRGKDRIS
jgi:hypothetical protein